MSDEWAGNAWIEGAATLRTIRCHVPGGRSGPRCVSVMGLARSIAQERSM